MRTPLSALHEKLRPGFGFAIVHAAAFLEPGCLDAHLVADLQRDLVLPPGSRSSRGKSRSATPRCRAGSRRNQFGWIIVDLVLELHGRMVADGTACASAAWIGLAVRPLAQRSDSPCKALVESVPSRGTSTGPRPPPASRPGRGGTRPQGLDEGPVLPSPGHRCSDLRVRDPGPGHRGGWRREDRRTSLVRRHAALDALARWGRTRTAVGCARGGHRHRRHHPGWADRRVGRGRHLCGVHRGRGRRPACGCGVLRLLGAVAAPRARCHVVVNAVSAVLALAAAVAGPAALADVLADQPLAGVPTSRSWASECGSPS